MTAVPEQPARRSRDPLLERVDEVDRRIAEIHARELADERSRADRLSGEVQAAIFVLSVIRRSHPKAVYAAIEMARTEPGTVPGWMDRMAGDAKGGPES